jgi:DNA polymerase elongation subunit (family B)
MEWRNVPVMQRRNVAIGTKKMFTPIELEKVSTFSKAFGAKSQTMINMHGSSCLDTYTIGNKEQKFSSFTLNYLSMFYFETKKADCPHEAIPGEQRRAAAPRTE